MLLDKAQALYSFWASFGIPAWDENTVPDNAQLPYITYETSTASFPDTINLAASIWYRDLSWAAADTKAAEISAGIGYGGMLVSCDGGAIWIKRGAPFSQRMAGEEDNVRRIYLNIEVDFLTEN